MDSKVFDGYYTNINTVMTIAITYCNTNVSRQIAFDTYVIISA